MFISRYQKYNFTFSASRIGNFGRGFFTEIYGIFKVSPRNNCRSRYADFEYGKSFKILSKIAVSVMMAYGYDGRRAKLIRV